MITDEMLTGRRWVVYSAPGTGVVYGYAVAWTLEGVIVVEPPRSEDKVRWHVIREPQLIIWDNILELYKTEWDAKQSLEGERR